MIDGSRKAGRKVWILAVVTAMAVVATAASVWQQQNRYKTNHIPELLFPDLKAAVNDVAEIRIEDRAAKFTLRRVEDTADDSDYRWVVADRQNYPAEISLVRMAILGLSEMKTTEPKTALSALHHRLGLNPPDTASDESKSRNRGTGVAVTLLDESGNTEAALLIGKRKGALEQPDEPPRGPVRQFVRRLDSDQTWLSDSAPLIDADPTRWLDHELLDVVRGRWRDATIAGDNGFVASRETPATYAFTIFDQTGEPVSEINPVDASAVGAALAFFKFDDVRRADDLDWSGARKLVFRTFDGLIVTLEVMRDGGDDNKRGVGLVRLEAAFDEVLAAEGAELTTDLHENFRADLRSPDDVAAEAAKINRIAEGWAYAVPEFKARELLKTMPDLLPKQAPNRQTR